MRQGSANLREAGFGQEVKRAFARRMRVLVQSGNAQDLGQGRMRPPSDLVRRLENREVERVGRAMAADRGLDWQAMTAGNHFEGELIGRKGGRIAASAIASASL